MTNLKENRFSFISCYDADTGNLDLFRVPHSVLVYVKQLECEIKYSKGGVQKAYSDRFVASRPQTLKQTAKAAAERLVNEIFDTIRVALQAGIVVGVAACMVWAFAEGWRN